jgi:hypothetical protein
MKLAGDVPLIVVTFLGTFYFTAWGMLLLIVSYYPGEFLQLAVPTLFALLAAVFVWTQSASTGGALGCGRRLGTGVVVWYLTTGVVLAVTRVALWVWVVHQRSHDIYTETNIFIAQWLYPEVFVSVFWRRLVALNRTEVYWIWGTLTAIGSFAMAMPILLVGWLRNRRTTS